MPHAASKEPRFPQLTMDQLNEQQRPLGEEIMKISRVGLGGPYNPMLRSPVFAKKMFDLLYYLRWQTSVPLKLNEFAILIVGRQWRSQVEWFAHAPLAVKAGLSPEIVADLKKNRRPANMPPEEAIVYDFITELTTRHAVSDETFARARQLLGRAAGCRSHRSGGHLHHHRDDACNGRAKHSSRRGAAVQTRRALKAEPSMMAPDCAMRSHLPASRSEGSAGSPDKARSGVDPIQSGACSRDSKRDEDKNDQNLQVVTVHHDPAKASNVPAHRMCEWGCCRDVTASRQFQPVARSCPSA